MRSRSLNTETAMQLQQKAGKDNVTAASGMERMFDHVKVAHFRLTWETNALFVIFGSTLLGMPQVRVGAVQRNLADVLYSIGRSPVERSRRNRLDLARVSWRS